MNNTMNNISIDSNETIAEASLITNIINETVKNVSSGFEEF
jgi:hypothetical protein